jgi:hypothetical protein
MAKLLTAANTELAELRRVTEEQRALIAQLTSQLERLLAAEAA